MVNTVFRKIKELSANEMKPRAAIPVPTLCQELNMTAESVRPVITELIELRLIKYNEPEKQSVKLTLLGTTVKR
jgi:RIO-like serine/threonine protein kinase